MERIIPQITGPTELLAFPFRQEELQDSERKLHEFDFLNSASVTTNNGGLQNAPDSDFSRTQWLPEFSTDYIYTDCRDGCQTEDPGHTSFDLSDMGPPPPHPRFFGVDMGASQPSDPERLHLMLTYNGPPIYQDVPRILLDQADRVRPIVETDGRLTDQMPVSGDVISELTATGGHSMTHNINWLQGHPPANQQAQYFGEGLKPHARPSGLGNEYVSNTLDHARGTDLKFLPDHQANGFHNHLAYRSKHDDLIPGSGDLLPSNGSNLGRRKSVPHSRLRKLSVVDQGTNHVPISQQTTQSARIQVFDSNMKIKPGRKKRRFSEGEKERIGRVRKVGACSECRLKKRRCDHALAGTSASSPGDESNGPITPAPEETLDAQALSVKEDLEPDLPSGQIAFLEGSGSLDFLNSPLCLDSYGRLTKTFDFKSPSAHQSMRIDGHAHREQEMSGTKLQVCKTATQYAWQ